MREVTVFASGAKKADWDVGMAVDAIRIGEILDVVILVTGDGDFVELVEYLRHHGRQVEVIAFKETTSSKLIEAADDYINLSDDLDRYLIHSTFRTQQARTPANSSVPAPATGTQALTPRNQGQARHSGGSASKNQQSGTRSPNNSRQQSRRRPQSQGKKGS
jgi:hypothetical protein